MTSRAGASIWTIQFERARPLSTGVAMTTAWSAASAAALTVRSAAWAISTPRRPILRLNRSGLATLFPHPFQVLIIKSPDHCHQVVPGLALKPKFPSPFVDPVPRYRPRCAIHPDVGARCAKLPERFNVEVQPREEHGGVEDKVRGRRSPLVGRLQDPPLTPPVLQLIPQDLLQFPVSSSSSPSRNKPSFIDWSRTSM